MLLALLAACGSRERPGDVAAIAFPQTETAIQYRARVIGAPSDEIRETIEASIALFQRQDDGAQSLAFLRHRAESDLPTVIRVLRSEGHYGATARVEVIERPPIPAGQANGIGNAFGLLGNGRPAGNGNGENGEDDEIRRATARIIIDPGPVYVLAAHRFLVPEAPDDMALPLGAPADYGSPVGGPAQAGPILEAERAAVTALRDAGRPWARADGRRAVADPAEATLEVDSRVVPGPHAVFGPIRFTGLDRVREDHLRSYLPWAEGAPVVASALRDYQRELMATELFAAASVSVPDAPPEDGDPVAPIEVRLEEGPRRSVSAGLRFNTDTGPLVRGTFRNRNLFGAGERLDAAAEVGLERQSLRFDLRKPQLFRPGQDGIAALEFRHEESDAFDELAVTGSAGLERRLSRRWTVGGGGLIELSQVTEAGVTTDNLLFGVPAFISYDGTTDPLDRSDGERATLVVIPFQRISDAESSPFLHLEATGAIYRPLDSDGAYVAAARGRIGTLVASDLSDVPANRRFYSGGGGSVRGFAERAIGPLDANNDPTGGLSVAEVGLELRARVRGDLGVVAFTDAGVVSTDSTPDFSEEVRFAAGLGLRYATPVGPIRLDVAVPLNPRRTDDSFAFYFSVGQAF